MKPQNNSRRIVFLLTNDFRFDSRVKKLAQAAAKFGYESHVVCYVSAETKTQRRQTEDLINIHRVGEVFQGLEKESLWKNILWFFPYIFIYGNPKNNKFIFEKALELKPQIVWANDASTLLIGVKLKKILNAKLVYDAHELWSEFPKVYHKNFTSLIFKFYALFYGWFIYLIERLYINKADEIITVNSTIARILQTQFQLNNKPKVITNAYPYLKNMRIDQRKFKSKFKIPQNCIVLAYSGYIGAGRASQIMLMSLTYLPKNYCLFALVPKTQIPNLKKQAKSLGIANRVFAHGFVKYENIAPLLSNCDLGLLLLEKTSKNLTFALPNKFFEYVQSGLPIVSGPHTHEINKIIRKESVGIIVKSFISQAVAETISSYLSDSTKYQEAKSNFNKLIKKKYSWENESQKVNLILRQLSY